MFLAAWQKDEMFRNYLEYFEEKMTESRLGIALKDDRNSQYS